MRIVTTSILTLLLTLAATPGQAQFLQDHPDLAQYLFHEPASKLSLGIGASPIGIMKHKVYMSASFFQAHWIGDWMDAELLSMNYGVTQARADYAGSRHFTLRTVPKFRINEIFSAGPLFGYEWVVFPDAKARMTKNSWHTPYEPFSTRGVIWGAVVSEMFRLESTTLRVSEVFYKQTYSVTKAGDGWEYWFENPELQNDPNRDEIKGDQVFAIEFAVMIGGRR